MEKRKTSCVIVIFVMLGMLAGESKANFKECYEGCFLKCAITPGKNMCSCATNCVGHCIFPHGLSTQSAGEDVKSEASQAYSFCQLGCSVFSCANNVTTPDKLPDGSTVANCVDSCGKTCATNYSPRG